MPRVWISRELPEWTFRPADLVRIGGKLAGSRRSAKIDWKSPLGTYTDWLDGGLPNPYRGSSSRPWFIGFHRHMIRAAALTSQGLLSALSPHGAADLARYGV